jgi:hypothetical protein
VAPVTPAESRHTFVVRVLQQTRFPGCPDEYALQRAAVLRLTAAGAPVQREYPLSKRDRPDALVGDLATGAVCVECKVAGAPGAVLCQLERYAAHRQVESLVLLTRKAAHRALPAEVGGKPLTVVFTAGVL